MQDNPYRGSALESAWEQGYRAGFVEGGLAEAAEARRLLEAAARGFAGQLPEPLDGPPPDLFPAHTARRAGAHGA